ncbi:MAG: sulfatase-like hydrolase/transferase [Planctomycetes bacterium]|nr:sulfatase-like hydrolase/transferase [Planctomycetota bacterium]
MLSYSRIRQIAARTVVILGLIATSGGVRAQPATRPSRPPNILFLMTDQQTYSVLGSSGNPIVKTPHLDRLAEQGVRFTQAACVTPFCSPTRASLWTGQWPHKHGITFNVAPDGRRPNRRRAQEPRASGLSDRHNVLHNVLADRGYQVAYFGKWHLGDFQNLRCFREQGDAGDERAAYREWLAGQGDAVASREPKEGEVFVRGDGGVFMNKAVAELVRGGSAGENSADAADGEGNEVKVLGRSAVALAAQFSTWLADRVMAWIERHADKPFMVTYSASPPHAPWVAPDPYYSMYDPARMVLPPSFADQPAVYRSSRAATMGAQMGEVGIREQLRCYYAQVSMVDEQVGRILKKLHDLGLDDNTLVIFTSDHGDMQGTHGMMGKSVHAFYEADVRVPLLLRHPPSISPGRVLDMACNSVDLMPTILDFAAIDAPPSVQGRSLKPVLTGAAGPDDRPSFCERGMGDRNTGRMIRTADWKYCLYAEGRRELFDLKRDPDEMKNVAADAANRAVAHKLDRQLRDWMHQTGDPVADKLPPLD